MKKNILIFISLLILPFLSLFFLYDKIDNQGVLYLLLGALLACWGFLIFWILRGIFRFFKKPREQTENIEEKRQDLDQQIDASKKRLEDLVELPDDLDFRFLDLDSLAFLSMHNIVEMIEIIKTKSDPLVRLALVYMLIEQLSENFKPEESSVGQFTYKFFKQELSEKDFIENFEDGVESPDFKNHDWCKDFQDKIRSAYSQYPDLETRSNICASFCADLVLEIDDDKVKERFVTLARKTLEENNTLTKSAESSLMSVEF